MTQLDEWFAALLLAFLLFRPDAVAKSQDTFVGSIKVNHLTRPDFATVARISIQEAITAAVRYSNGKVTEAALIEERGFLVYEIEVSMPDHRMKEVIIDAGNGKVLKSESKSDLSVDAEGED